MSRLGKELIGGLRELSDSLKRKERLSDKFTCHSIVLDFQPTQYDAASVKKFASCWEPAKAYSRGSWA